MWYFMGHNYYWFTGSQTGKSPPPVFVIFRVIAMIINLQYHFFQSSIINFCFFINTFWWIMNTSFGACFENSWLIDVCLYLLILRLHYRSGPNHAGPAVQTMLAWFGPAHFSSVLWLFTLSNKLGWPVLAHKNVLV